MKHYGWFIADIAGTILAEGVVQSEGWESASGYVMGKYRNNSRAHRAYIGTGSLAHRPRGIGRGVSFSC